MRKKAKISKKCSKIRGKVLCIVQYQTAQVCACCGKQVDYLFKSGANSVTVLNIAKNNLMKLICLLKKERFDTIVFSRNEGEYTIVENVEDFIKKIENNLK
jgi:hypothetical protein